MRQVFIPKVFWCMPSNQSSSLCQRLEDIVCPPAKHIHASQFLSHCVFYTYIFSPGYIIINTVPGFTQTKVFQSIWRPPSPSRANRDIVPFVDDDHEKREPFRSIDTVLMWPFTTLLVYKCFCANYRLHGRNHDVSVSHIAISTNIVDTKFRGDEDKTISNFDYCRSI